MGQVVGKMVLREMEMGRKREGGIGIQHIIPPFYRNMVTNRI
jgi:hypothetical protein